MAYKFQVGPASMSGSLVQTGSISVLDQAGAVQFSVEKANGNVSAGTLGCGVVTSTGVGSFGGALDCATSLTIDAIAVTSAEFNALAGVTKGTAIASKAVTTDTNIDTTGQRNLTITGELSASTGDFSSTIAVAGAATLASAVVTAGATFGGGYGATGATISTAGVGQFDGAITSAAQVLGTTISGSSAVRSGLNGALYGFNSAGAAKFGATTATSLSASSTLTIVGASNLKGNIVAEGAMNVSGAVEMVHTVINVPNVAATDFHGADYFIGRDSATGDLQARTVAKVTADLAGIGLSAGTGSLALDLNELPGYASSHIKPAADSLALLSNASGSVKSTIADLATNMAGAGVTATNGVFSVDTTGGDTMSSVGIANLGVLVPGLNYFGALIANAAVTLPTSPGIGDIIVVKAHTIAANKAITINRAGTQTIDGLTSLQLRSEYGAVTLIAATAGTAADWRIA